MLGKQVLCSCAAVVACLAQAWALPQYDGTPAWQHRHHGHDDGFRDSRSTDSAQTENVKGSTTVEFATTTVTQIQTLQTVRLPRLEYWETCALTSALGYHHRGWTLHIYLRGGGRRKRIRTSCWHHDAGTGVRYRRHCTDTTATNTFDHHRTLDAFRSSLSIGLPQCFRLSRKFFLFFNNNSNRDWHIGSHPSHRTVSVNN